jgi:hypothetical protein
MEFSRMVFGVAAVYGFLVFPPLYFFIGKIDRDLPPLGILWQVVFVFNE